MAGLLDFLNTDEGRLGLGLLAAAGPRADGMNAGGRIQLAMQGVDDRKQEALKQKMLAQQFEQNTMTLEKARRDNTNQAGLATLMPQYFQPGVAARSGTDMVESALPDYLRTGAMPATPATAPKFDVSGYAGAALQRGFMNPLEAIQLQQAMAKDTHINKLDVKDFTPASVAKFAQSNNYGDLVRMDRLHFADTGGGVTGLNQFTGVAVGTTPKTGDPFKDLILQNPSGGFQANSPLVAAKLSLAKAAAPNVNTTVSVAGPENMYNSTVGKGLADVGLGLVDVAKSAPETVRNAQMIRQALNNGAITGTGADTRLAVQKALETAGLVGEGKAADTQALMSGLAKMTLSGVKTSGLGAGNGFTDKDLVFLQSATSGQIDSTPANLRRAADLSERIARANYQKGSKVLERWKGDKALSAVAQDSALDSMPDAPAAPSLPMATMRFNTRTGKLEKVN